MVTLINLGDNGGMALYLTYDELAQALSISLNPMDWDAMRIMADRLEDEVSEEKQEYARALRGTADYMQNLMRWRQLQRLRMDKPEDRPEPKETTAQDIATCNRFFDRLEHIRYIRGGKKSELPSCSLFSENLEIDLRYLGESGSHHHNPLDKASAFLQSPEIQHLTIRVRDYTPSESHVSEVLRAILSQARNINQITIIDSSNTPGQGYSQIAELIAEHGADMPHLRRLNFLQNSSIYSIREDAARGMDHVLERERPLIRKTLKALMLNENMKALEEIRFSASGEYGLTNYLALVTPSINSTVEQPLTYSSEYEQIYNRLHVLDANEIAHLISDRQSMLGQERLVPRTTLGLRWHHEPGSEERQAAGKFTARLHPPEDEAGPGQRL